MTTSSDTDLKELKDLINTRFNQLDGRFNQLEGRFNQLEGRFDRLEERIQALEIGQAKIETRLEEWKPAIQKIPDLIEKVEDTGAELVPHRKMSVGELKNWRQIALIVITVFGGGLFGWFLRSGKL